MSQSSPSKNFSPQRDVYTVSRLNLEAQGLLESSFPLLWLEGEISNLSRPASGHMYFSLKDERAQVSAAMFRGRNQRLRFRPGEGMQVLVRARVTLYQPRGNFQIIVEHMEEAGEGKLQRQFEQLKQKLQQEGLFDSERKKQVPSWPKQVGIITSASGAALRDILHILKRRCPSQAVLIYPAAVQGQQASGELRQALATAIDRNECDVLIIGRGGGSLEDLWAFNDEALARDIADCPIPVISAVGHEVDFALTDFVADLRAPTPSAAAEMASPDTSQLKTRLQRYQLQLGRLMRQQLKSLEQSLALQAQRIVRPDQRLRQYAQQLDETENRFQRSMQYLLEDRSNRLTQLDTRLSLRNPESQLESLKQRLAAQQQASFKVISDKLVQQQNQLSFLGKRLHLASPLATMDRGYSITFKESIPLRSIKDIRPDDVIHTRLGDGLLISQVTDIQPKEGK